MPIIIVISLVTTCLFGLLYVISSRPFRGEFSPHHSVAKTIWRLEKEGRPGAKKMKVLFLCFYGSFVVLGLAGFTYRFF